MEARDLREDEPRRLTPPVAVVLGGLSAFGPLSIDMYLPALPRLAADFHVPPPAVQLTVSACLIGLGLGQLVAGPVSDALGRRRPLLIGVFLYALASVAAAVAPSLGVLVAMRFLQGLAGAAGIAIARAVVRDLFEGREVARVFALLMLVTGVAPVAAPVLGGQILRFADWRVVFLVLGAIGVLIAAGAIRWLPESLPAERRRAGGVQEAARGFRELASSRQFMGCALSLALTMTVLFSYISASPFVLQTQYGLTAQQFSLVFAANSIAIVGGSQLSAHLARRVAIQRLLVAGLATSVVAASLLLVSAVAWLGLVAFLVPLALAIGSLGLVIPNASALAVLPHPRSAGAASARLGALQFAVGALVAPLTGLAVGTPATAMALVIAAAALAGFLAFATLAGVRTR
ncbi:MAG TPA: multidrug effflux MFS transporter [Candidatus Dormibacteraeota bacterium]